MCVYRDICVNRRLRNKSTALEYGSIGQKGRILIIAQPFTSCITVEGVSTKSVSCIRKRTGSHKKAFRCAKPPEPLWGKEILEDGNVVAVPDNYTYSLGPHWAPSCVFADKTWRDLIKSGPVCHNEPRVWQTNASTSDGWPSSTAGSRWYFAKARVHFR